MRHRIGGGITGLGNPAAEMMSNNWPTDRRRNSLVRRCLMDAINKYFTKHYTIGTWTDTSAWCDFGVDNDGLMIGQEPAYFGDDLAIVYIARDKRFSYIERGHAFGYYGSGIRSTRRYYKDYKRKSKFVRFIDRWHPILFPD